MVCRELSLLFPKSAASDFRVLCGVYRKWCCDFVASWPFQADDTTRVSDLWAGLLPGSSLLGTSSLMNFIVGSVTKRLTPSLSFPIWVCFEPETGLWQAISTHLSSGSFS